MDLINDLGSDLAVAFLVEQRHRQRLDWREAKNLIDRIEAALQKVSEDDSEKYDLLRREKPNPIVSH